jgi:hypothetical protein
MRLLRIKLAPTMLAAAVRNKRIATAVATPLSYCNMKMSWDPANMLVPIISANRPPYMLAMSPIIKPDNLPLFRLIFAISNSISSVLLSAAILPNCCPLAEVRPGVAVAAVVVDTAAVVVDMAADMAVAADTAAHSD